MLALIAPPIEQSERREWLSKHIPNMQWMMVESQVGERELKALGFHGAIEFYNEHTKPAEIRSFIEKLKQMPGGLMSDGGAPCVGDPGWELVRLCHQENIDVQCAGVHSFVWSALLLSGCPAQHFSFMGYPPKNKEDREKWAQELLNEHRGETVVVIETPYRFHYVVETLTEILPENAWLSVSLDLGSTQQKTMAGEITAWKKKRFSISQEKPLGVIVIHTKGLSAIA